MQLRLSRIALIHALCQVPVMLALVDFAAEFVATEWGRNHRIVGLAAWSIQPLPPKIQSIVEYGLLLAIAAALVLAVTAYVRANGKAVAFSAWHWLALAFYEGACLLPILVFGNSALATIVWFVLVPALPAWLASRYLRPSVRVDRFFLAATGTCLAFVLWVLFSSSWFPELRFLNDYSDLREYTRMDSGQVVENHEFMRERRAAGRSLVDPCTAKSDADLPAGTCLRLSRSVFSSAREPFLLFPPGRGLVYDWDKETLFAHQYLSDEQIALIGAVWGLGPDEATLERFVASAAEAHAKAEEPRSKTAEEVEFFRKNQIELATQHQLGWFFHHHAYLYQPALEKAEFPGQSITPAQYGDGLTRALGWLLHQSGAPTFQSYYMIYWVALGAYLALLGITVLLITRDAWAGVAAVALGTGALLAISHDALRVAPGFNPMRHFPDLLCMLAVAIDARRRSYGSALLRAGAIGLLLWWNREFGLFFLGGSVAWLLIEIAAGDRGWRGGMRQIGLEVAVALVVVLAAETVSGGDLARYNLIGVGSPVTRWRHVFSWIFLWTSLVGWFVWARFGRMREDDTGICRSLSGVAGVGALYAAFASVYAVWNPSPNHVAVVFLLAVVPFVAIVVWAGKSPATGWASSSWLMRYVAAASLAIVVYSTAIDQASHREFEKVFEDHLPFSWNFQGLSGTSTADPATVRDGVALIGKHQPAGRVLLLSRYESLLRTLTNRAGVLPYVDLPSALVSWEMIDKVADQIVRSGAPVLFVDRDILANREAEIPLIGGKPDSVAAHRVGSLAALGLLSRVIARCYAPGETGGVLQAWHRSCKADGR